MRLEVASLGAVLIACGGRTSSPETGMADASALEAATGWVDGAATSTFDGADPCSPGGVRLCGGACGKAEGCVNCTPLLTGSGSIARYGVRWSDLGDLGSTPCALCDDGQGCVRLSPDRFVCVPLDACGALLALGAGDVCWYGDKVAFDGAAVGVASGCPDDSTKNVCGGDCPPCYSDTLSRCVGRGPDHPFGICPDLLAGGSATDVSNYPTCSVGAKEMVPCPNASYANYACAVSPYPPGASAVAPLTGLCLDATECSSLAKSLPGGLWCFNSSGVRVAP